MSIEEIQSEFNVDIRLKNCKRYMSYLKWLLIEQELKKGRDLMELAEDVNLHYSRVQKNSKMLEQVKNGEVFIKVKQAFETKDAKLFETLKDFSNTPKAEPKAKKKWSVEKIINTLRKDNGHPLWNKTIENFTDSDYNILQKLN
jgi:hypothetical protein